MLSFDQYQSEEQAYYDFIFEAIKGYEREIMAIFIQEGPDALRYKLRIKRDEDWNRIFDYLVFQKDLLKVCVLQFIDFFKKLVEEKGPLAMRSVLGIQSRMYDSVFEGLFDLVAVSHGALFQHVETQKRQLFDQIKAGKGSELRENLGLSKQKYDNLWEEIVKSLLNDFGVQLVDERIMEQGLSSFARLFNMLRDHRPL